MSEKKQCIKTIIDRIEGESGLLFIDTTEETRLIRELHEHYDKDTINFWSIGQGIHEIPQSKTEEDKFYPYKFISTQAKAGKGNFKTQTSINDTFSLIEEECREKIKDENTKNKRYIYILRDLDVFLKDPAIVRRLKDLVYLCSVCCGTIIVTGNCLNVPLSLDKDVIFIRLPLPTREDIKLIIDNTKKKIEYHNTSHGDEEKKDLSFNEDEVINASMGLTEDEIINTLQYSLAIDGKIDVQRIIEQKKAIIDKSDILEYWPTSDTLDDVGGFQEIKEWFKIKQAIIQHPENAKKFGAKQPKGIMLLGTQGSGKTLIAKALAQTWKVGLTKFDIAKVFSGLVGDSEKRTRMALAQIDAAGGVVVIDEIDKALSGAGSSDKSDGGTTNRVIGTFLTWLNEDHPGVFIVATANDISRLIKNHPELLRKGRFDEIWFSDVPNTDERKEILSIHLKKRKRNLKKFDLDKLSEYTFKDETGEYYLTGAEIESSINDAIQEKFAMGNGKEIKIGSEEDITTDDILKAMKVIKPITKIAKNTISEMRKWSMSNARNVSKLTIQKPSTKRKGINLRNDIQL